MPVSRKATLAGDAQARLDRCHDDARKARRDREGFSRPPSEQEFLLRSERLTNLPAGTVTFLFSDIEGSTGLLKRLGERYAELIADHRRIIRDTFGEHGGIEIDRQGDSFFFAFARAREAVAAAVEAQRAHAACEWPGGENVRVRMGLHTGEPAVGAEGYLGVDVVRAARLSAAGSGGHVLLSETTRALLGSSLPTGVSVLPLGERRLKDIEEPERVYQLAIEGVEQPEAEPAAAVGSADDWERRHRELVERMTARINERVYETLERSLGGFDDPR
jgi:class 3 adenylate cyclase